MQELTEQLLEIEGKQSELPLKNKSYQLDP